MSMDPLHQGNIIQSQQTGHGVGAPGSRSGNFHFGHHTAPAGANRWYGAYVVVKDTAGNPISGVAVQLHFQSLHYIYYTDINGRARIGFNGAASAAPINMPGLVSLTKAGYADGQQNVTLSTQLSTYNISLTPNNTTMQGVTGASPFLNINNHLAFSGVTGTSTSGHITGTPGIEVTTTNPGPGVTIPTPSLTVVKPGTGSGAASGTGFNPQLWLTNNWHWVLALIIVIIVLYLAYKK